MAISITSVIVTFPLLLSQGLACPPNYNTYHGVCLRFTRGFTGTWCAAQAWCANVDGEIVTGANVQSLNGKSFPGQPYHYWIGLTDFLQERRKSGANWRWTNGALEPQSSGLTWLVTQPNEDIPDCGTQCFGNGVLCNTPCTMKLSPVCQPRPERTLRVKRFQLTTIPTGLASVEYAQAGGCTKLLTGVETKMQCADICSKEKTDMCASFYYHQAKKECRLVLYTDATVNMGNAEGLEKFIAINE